MLLSACRLPDCFADGIEVVPYHHKRHLGLQLTKVADWAVAVISSAVHRCSDGENVLGEPDTSLASTDKV